jgi:hypothetical protein
MIIFSGVLTFVEITRKKNLNIDSAVHILEAKIEEMQKQQKKLMMMIYEKLLRE